MIYEAFKIKYYNISELDMYLGATIYKMSMGGGRMWLTVSAEHYVNALVTNVEDIIDRDGISLI